MKDLDAKIMYERVLVKTEKYGSKEVSILGCKGHDSRKLLRLVPG
jgi:hypothetical protein